MRNKAIIAMSGGVDSSVAALLMKKMGYDCVGATMKLFHNADVQVSDEHTCCSLEDTEDAASVAALLHMPHYVFNFADKFRETVMDAFVEAYENGRTPNPCIACNRYLKFDKLFSRAKDLACDFVATGHYAQVFYDNTCGRFLLKKAVDETKDQSYVLYMLTQKQLAHILFPLGGMQKTEVRKIAQEYGFVNAGKHDSQDICFVPDGKYADFITQYTGKKYPQGNFRDIYGNVLGTHKGIIHYTIGQRRGLGIPAPMPLYVQNVCPETNTVILGTEETLYEKELTAKDINLISVSAIQTSMRVKAKIRYRQKEQPVTVWQTDADTLHLEFDEPQRAITKGQAVVLYDGDIVVGGGTIQ